MSAPTESDRLLDLLSLKDDLAREYAARRYDYDEKKVSYNLVEGMKADGWSLAKENKKAAVMRFMKSEWDFLEDKVWSMLYLLGFSRMNAGRHFMMPPRKSGFSARQIDVLALDDEAAVIVECKHQDRMGSKDLTSIINEFAARKADFGNSLRRDAVVRGVEGYDPKIIMILATSGITWSKSDIDLAADRGVARITDNELSYFMEVAKNIGHAARFQFNAEFLAGQDIRGLKGTSYPALRQKIGGKRAYFFVAPARELIKFAFVNHRQLRDVDCSPSYQRLITKARLANVSQFIDKGGYFANAILVSIKDRAKGDCRFEHKGSDDNSTAFGTLLMSCRYKSMKIIDGQHRLYGAAQSEIYPDTNICVVALADISEFDEAKLFKDINKEQKSVEPSLISDLDGDLEFDSIDPIKRIGAISARAIDLLLHGSDPTFQNRSGGGQITKAEMQTAIKASGLIGSVRVRGKSKILIPGVLSRDSNQETLEVLTRFLTWYFGKIRAANIDLWNERRYGFPCSNVSLAAHLGYISDVVRSDERQNGTWLGLSEAEFRKRIERRRNAFAEHIGRSDVGSYAAEFPSIWGGRGSDMKMRIAQAIYRIDPELRFDGLDEFERTSAVERISKFTSDVALVADRVLQSVKYVIADRIGDEFWGIKLDPEFGKTLSKRRVEAKFSKGNTLENYMEFADIDNYVVGKRDFWPHVKPLLDIVTPMDIPGKRKHTAWMKLISRRSSNARIDIVPDDEFEVVEIVKAHLIGCKDYQDMFDEEGFGEKVIGRAHLQAA